MTAMLEAVDVVHAWTDPVHACTVDAEMWTEHGPVRTGSTETGLAGFQG